MNLTENANPTKLGSSIQAKSQDLGSKATELKAQLGDIAKHGMEDLEESFGTVKGYATKAISFVKARPVPILMGAAVIGLVAAYFITSKSKSKSNNFSAKHY